MTPERRDVDGEIHGQQSGHEDLRVVDGGGEREEGVVRREDCGIDVVPESEVELLELELHNSEVGGLVDENGGEEEHRVGCAVDQQRHAHLFVQINLALLEEIRDEQLVLSDDYLRHCQVHGRVGGRYGHALLIERHLEGKCVGLEVREHALRDGVGLLSTDGQEISVSVATGVFRVQVKAVPLESVGVPSRERGRKVGVVEGALKSRRFSHIDHAVPAENGRVDVFDADDYSVVSSDGLSRLRLEGGPGAHDELRVARQDERVDVQVAVVLEGRFHLLLRERG